MFKLDNGQLCIVMVVDGKCNRDQIRHLDMTTMTDKFDDLSSTDPFEFVFCNWGDSQLHVNDKKTIIPNKSFITLYDANALFPTIEADFARQFTDKQI